jgi:cardiolipin synthase
MIIRKRDFFLLPNLLAFLRIALLPLIFYFLVLDTRSSIILALILIAVATATDFFDGYFARRLNQVTDLGKILDPLADKLGLATVVIFIIVYRGFPVWAALLLLLKDILTLIAAIVMVRRKGFILMSNVWGKLNSGVWVLTVIVFAAKIEPLQQSCLILATVSVANTIIQYARMFFAQYRLETTNR